MKPVLFQIGPFPVSSFGVFLLVAFVAGILLLRARTTRWGWDGGEILDLSLYSIIGGVIGARIGYVLVNLRDFSADWARVLTIWRDAGLTFYGALAGGALIAWLYSRRRSWSFGWLADAATPGLALGYAIAMIGTLLYGLNYGRAANVPWAVVLFGEPRHPTQLYLMLAAVIILAIVRPAVDRPHAPGRVFWAFLALYGIARAVVELFMDSPRVVGPLTLAQAVSLAVAVVSLGFWLSLGGRAVEAGPAGVADASAAPSPGAGTGAASSSKTGDPRA
ncbi:MAG TPA: prolipoprotein diacylglyceryl transferase [bacterium]|nr:prolipoprotein diacylglyceryl transferase [bacterium]